jgi:flagellar biosynthesis/type III secretory pathway protein FliH
MRNVHWVRWTALALALSFSAGCVATAGAQGRRGGGWGPPSSQSRYVDVAYARGYDEGYTRGRADARSRERYDARRHRAYRQADSGWDRRYGSRDAYKQIFRRGFTTGYEEGYRDARRGRGRW